MARSDPSYLGWLPTPVTKAMEGRAGPAVALVWLPIWGVTALADLTWRQVRGEPEVDSPDDEPTQRSG